MNLLRTSQRPRNPSPSLARTLGSIRQLRNRIRRLHSDLLLPFLFLFWGDLCSPFLILYQSQTSGQENNFYLFGVAELNLLPESRTFGLLAEHIVPLFGHLN